MTYVKYIKYYYILLTLLVFITPITADVLLFIPALVLMWISFIILKLSTRHYSKLTQVTTPLFSDNNNYKFSIFIVIFALLFIPQYVKFYTGGSIIQNAVNFMSASMVGSESTYSMYQRYFEENMLGSFSLIKVPYILGAGLMKFLFWSLTFRVIVFKRKAKAIEYISIIIISVLYMLQGMSRGTSFELFELLLLFIFSYIYRNKIINKSNKINSRQILSIIFVLSVAVSYFIYSKSLRHDGIISTEGGTRELQFDPNAFVSQTFPILSSFSFGLFGYFGFGIFFTSISLITICNSFQGVAALLIPRGIFLTYETSIRKLICGKVIDCGAAWIPDIIVYIENLGLVGTFTFIYIMGKASKKLNREVINGSIISTALLYIIALFFISLPVGNFITASSSNVIAITILIGLRFFPINKKIKNYFYTYQDQQNVKSSSCKS